MDYRTGEFMHWFCPCSKRQMHQSSQGWLLGSHLKKNGIDRVGKRVKNHINLKITSRPAYFINSFSCRTCTHLYYNSYCFVLLMSSLLLARLRFLQEQRMYLIHLCGPMFRIVTIELQKVGQCIKVKQAKMFSITLFVKWFDYIKKSKFMISTVGTFLEREFIHHQVNAANHREFQRYSS